MPSKVACKSPKDALQCRRGAPCGRECLDPGAAATHGADEVTAPGKDDDIPAIVSFSLSLPFLLLLLLLLLF